MAAEADLPVAFLLVILEQHETVQGHASLDPAGGLGALGIPGGGVEDVLAGP